MSTDGGPSVPSTAAQAEPTAEAQSSEPAAASAPPAAGAGLNNRLRRAAEAAGIDLAFLEALPEELRAEVLAMHGANVGDEEESDDEVEEEGYVASCTVHTPNTACTIMAGIECHVWVKVCIASAGVGLVLYRPSARAVTCVLWVHL